MMQYELYTAVGRLQIKRVGIGRRYPVIVINRKEYAVDPQELTVWTALCWRLCDMDALARHYEQLFIYLPSERRTFENCVSRLVTRGLIARGMGDTQFEALYDLLADLYVKPIHQGLRGLFRRDWQNEDEAKMMSLSRQALLSTAELVKCAEVGVNDVSTEDKVMDALYADDDTTSDNIGMLMRYVTSREPVTVAIANLYLRRQITFEKV